MKRGRPKKQADPPQPPAATPAAFVVSVDDVSVRSPSQIRLGDFFLVVSVDKGGDPVVGMIPDVVSTGLIANPIISPMIPPIFHIPGGHVDMGKLPSSQLNLNSLNFELKGIPLEQFPEMAVEQEDNIGMEDIESELDYWKNTLVGQVIGARPKLDQVKEYVAKYWNNIVVLLEVLKKWVPFFGKEMEFVTTVPVWVLFPDLDPCLWSAKTLSKIASKLGTALFADHFTACKAKLSLARVHIEVDVSKDLQTALNIRIPFGPITRNVEYEWVPYFCQCFKKMGHMQDQCKLNRVKVPPPKASKIYKEKAKVPQKNVVIVHAPMGEAVVYLVDADVEAEIAVGEPALGILSSPDSVLGVLPSPVGGGDGFVSVSKIAHKIVDKGKCGIPMLNMFATLEGQSGKVLQPDGVVEMFGVISVGDLSPHDHPQLEHQGVY